MWIMTILFAPDDDDSHWELDYSFFCNRYVFVCPSIFRLVFETTYIPDIFRVIIVSPTVFCVEAPLICLDSIKCAESAKRFGSLKKTKTASFISLRKPLLSTSILILQCHLTKLLISNVNEEKVKISQKSSKMIFEQMLLNLWWRGSITCSTSCNFMLSRLLFSIISVCGLERKWKNGFIESDMKLYDKVYRSISQHQESKRSAF